MRKIPRLLPLIAVAIGGVAVVRLLGAGPDLFQGARAWAEDATSVAAAAAPARPAPAVCALTPEQLADQAGISPAELRIIQSLSTRRGELDARDQDFATMLPLMVAAEQKLDERIATLTALRGEVERLLGQADEREQAEIDRMVAVYQAMRPREAAAVFTTLDDEVRLPVAAAMRPRALAAIMAQMPPAAARDLTQRLAGRYEAGALQARADAAVADTTAQGAQARNQPTQTAQAAPSTAQPTPQPTSQPTANRPAANPPAPTRAAARPPARSTPAATPAAQTAEASPDAPPRQTVN